MFSSVFISSLIVVGVVSAESDAGLSVPTLKSPDFVGEDSGSFLTATTSSSSDEESSVRASFIVE